VRAQDYVVRGSGDDAVTLGRVVLHANRAQAGGVGGIGGGTRRLGELSPCLYEAPIGVAILDLDGRFSQVNAALCAMTGYSAEQLKATRWRRSPIRRTVSRRRSGSRR